jgi:site-specific recombinase XerD
MTRLVLPLEEWPQADQQAWETAIQTGDILNGHGPASHWRPTTRRTNIEHYGRWLGYLARTETPLEGAKPEDRVTREAVSGYLASLQARLAPRSVTSDMVGLKVMMKAMAPNSNWRWLEDICNYLNRTSLPSKDKRLRMKPTGDIVELALSGLDRLGATALTRRIDRVAYRDHLMLALLALRPLRLGNFAGLQIGRHLVQVAGRWQIDIPGTETKTRQPLLFDVPRALHPYLEIYINRVRQTFIVKATGPSDYLWLGFEGGRLTYHSVYQRIVFLTEKLFGHPINPHLLRDCAATTLSTRSVDDALSAAPLLGHRSFATTERYYIRANQLEASRSIANALKLARMNNRKS